MSPAALDPAPLELARETAGQQAGIDTVGIDLDALAVRELGGLVLMRAQRFDRFTAAAISTDLPVQTGAVQGTDPAVLCLAPGEWFGIASADRRDALQQWLSTEVDGAGVLRDVSDGHAVLRLAGAAAPWLLAKLSGLDYLNGRQQGDHCARTRVVDIAALVYFHTVNEACEVFDLIVDRSYTAYLWALLQSAAPHAIELSTTMENSA